MFILKTFIGQAKKKLELDNKVSFYNDNENW